MKLLLRTLLCFSIVAFVINGCKKTSIFDEQGNLEANSDFNAANIKTWYYKTFETSAEGKLNGTDKKYPVWKNGISYTLSSFEVFEFPLIKNKKQMDVSSSLSKADKTRVAESSLTKIRFIKDKTGNISVLEVNYIPEIQYLRNNNYDISNVAMGKENTDFTGRMVLSKWNGGLISIYIFKDGKATGKINAKKGLALARVGTSESNYGGCPGEQAEHCTVERWCDVYADGLTTNCTEWEVVEGSCYCEGGVTDPCEGLSDEACACQMTGVCGGGDDPPDEIDECSTTENNPLYQNFVAAIIPITPSTTMTTGASTIINANEDSKPVSWDVMGGYWGKITSIEILKRERQVVNTNLIWIIKDFVHASHDLERSTWISASPHGVETSNLIFTPNIQNVLSASMRATGTLKFKFCGISLPFRDKSIDETQFIHPNQ